MKRILGMSVVAALFLSTQAYAVPMSIFELYGDAPRGSDVEALWKGEVMADSEADDGHFELDIPMGKQLPYHKGDKLEIRINDKAAGRLVAVGQAGTARRISLHTH